MTARYRLSIGGLLLLVGIAGAWAALRDVAARLEPPNTGVLTLGEPSFAFVPAFSVGPLPGDLRDLVLYADSGVIENPYTGTLDKPKRAAPEVSPDPFTFPDMPTFFNNPQQPRIRPSDRLRDRIRDDMRERRRTRSRASCDLPGC